MFVKVCTIETGQSVCIFGEVGWNPVEDDADIGLMAGVNKGHKVIGCAVAASGREVACYLIAP